MTSCLSENTLFLPLPRSEATAHPRVNSTTHDTTHHTEHDSNPHLFYEWVRSYRNLFYQKKKSFLSLTKKNILGYKFSRTVVLLDLLPLNSNTLQNWSHRNYLQNALRVFLSQAEALVYARPLCYSVRTLSTTASEWCRIQSNNWLHRSLKHFPCPSNKSLLPIFSGIHDSLLKACNQKGVTCTPHYRVISQRSPGHTMGGNPALPWKVCWESLIKSSGRRNLGFGFVPALSHRQKMHS